ncbi:MAG TPA: NirD/YgiW/YdeI family stress tolerance protein [Candidatus Methylacidiphilales bacterium]|nr:NirD/YgiW/YdeI family stress tolerance protein [Candidatus Methylacidiphilales bacterium]
MKKVFPVFLVMLALFGVPTAISQADPPYHLTTVSWIISTRNNMNVDDRYVTLVGQVTQRIGDETYWFTDGTGSVRLDSADFVLPIGPKVVIGGRIDQAYLGFGHLEVDVRHWHLVKQP